MGIGAILGGVLGLGKGLFGAIKARRQRKRAAPPPPPLPKPAFEMAPQDQGEVGHTATELPQQGVDPNSFRPQIATVPSVTLQQPRLLDDAKNNYMLRAMMNGGLFGE